MPNLTPPSRSSVYESSHQAREYLQEAPRAGIFDVIYRVCDIARQVIESFISQVSESQAFNSLLDGPLPEFAVDETIESSETCEESGPSEAPEENVVENEIPQETRDYTECPISLDRPVSLIEGENLKEGEYNITYSVKVGTNDYNIFLLIKALISNAKFPASPTDIYRNPIKDEELEAICEFFQISTDDFFNIWRKAQIQYDDTIEIVALESNPSEEQQIESLTYEGAEEDKCNEIRGLRDRLFSELIQRSLGEYSVKFQAFLECYIAQS